MHPITQIESQGSVIASVAQLVSALPSHGRGHWFKSSWKHKSYETYKEGLHASGYFSLESPNVSNEDSRRTTLDALCEGTATGPVSYDTLTIRRPFPLLDVASSSYDNRGVPKRLRDRSAKPSFTGSTPVSASRSSTRIWVHSSADRAPVSGAGDHGFESHWTHPCNARVVQWLEHLSYTQEVDGSSPSTSTQD